MSDLNKIGFGGSCHWCTEAIFQSLKGVLQVDQGWIASDGDYTDFSEAVILLFDPLMISLELLIAVHLFTHSCTSQHCLRGRYRSAVYTFDDSQVPKVQIAFASLQEYFTEKVITLILPHLVFKLNKIKHRNYFYSEPGRPFCKNIVLPKLRELTVRFPELVDPMRSGLFGFSV